MLIRVIRILNFFLSKHKMFFMGLLLGIALSLFGIPFIEETCNTVSRILTTRKSYELVGQHHGFFDYEPIINLQGKPKIPAKLPRSRSLNVNRPRYYSSELGIRETLFVAVLSSNYAGLKNGSALNQTLNNYANKIVYFTSDRGSIKPDINYSNLIALSNEKPLEIGALEYIVKSYLKSYNYFLFIKDSAYIQTSNLESLINKFSVSEIVYMGHLVKDDAIVLEICSLDYGILVSNNVLQNIASHLDYCFQNAQSDDNLNFGHCLYLVSNLGCQSEIKGVRYKTLFWNSTSEYHNSTELLESVVIYPITEYKNHLKMTKFLRQQELKSTYDIISEMKKNIEARNGTWPGGVESIFKPTSRFDVYSWKYFNQTHFFLEDEFKICEEITGAGKKDIEDILASSKKYVSLRNSDYRDIEFTGGYKRFDPTRGMEYILDLTLIRKDNGVKVPERITAIRPLSKVELINVPYVTEHSRIVLVVLVTPKAIHRAKYFIENYAEECLKKQDNSLLIFVFLDVSMKYEIETDDPFYELKSMARNYTNVFHSTNGRIVWVGSSILGFRSPISTLPIMDLLIRKLTPDSLILLCDVSMAIKTEFLNRVRMNTIHGTQVFFPIPFIQYHTNMEVGKSLNDNDLPTIEVKNGMGRFDVENFKHSAFYVFDYITSRKSVESSIPSARSEKDLKRTVYYGRHVLGLHDMFIAAKLVHVMRATEPDLRLWHDEFDCDSQYDAMQVETYDFCINDHSKNLGPRAMLASMILKKKARDKMT